MAKWLKRVLGAGATVVPAVRSARAMGAAIQAVASTDEERQAAALLTPRLAARAAEAAAALAEVDAPARSFGQAGWRPAMGWACVAILFWNYLAYDLVSAAGVPLPPRSEEMITVLLTALGIAGLRTREKAQGVSR